MVYGGPAVRELPTIGKTIRRDVHHAHNAWPAKVEPGDALARLPDHLEHIGSVQRPPAPIALQELANASDPSVNRRAVPLDHFDG